VKTTTCSWPLLLWKMKRWTQFPGCRSGYCPLAFTPKTPKGSHWQIGVKSPMPAIPLFSTYVLSSREQPDPGRELPANLFTGGTNFWLWTQGLRAKAQEEESAFLMSDFCWGGPKHLGLTRVCCQLCFLKLSSLSSGTRGRLHTTPSSFSKCSSQCFLC
jgi:hypothetical protein